MARRRHKGGRRMRRSASGRFLKASHNPSRRRRVSRRQRSSNPRRPRPHFLKRIMTRRNPLGFPDFQTIGGIALGAVVVRMVTPRVTRLVPIAFLQSGWGQVVATLAVGAGLSWGANKFLGGKWGSAVLAGAIASAGVQAADLVVPGGVARVGAYDDEPVAVGAYDAPTQLADGTSISGTGGVEIGAYMGPNY